MTTDSMFTLQDVPGKGKGLVATQKIPAGTRILSEKPAIAVPEGEFENEQAISQQVDALDKSQRDAFLSMHNIYPFGNPAEQYLGIVRTNALPIEAGNIGRGIFLDACRINHACDNNSQKNWNENIKRHTVHARRDIQEGEEITIYYTGVHKTRKARINVLQERFHFTCSCRLCSLPPKQSQESDARLERILQLDNLIGRDGMQGILSSPLQILRYVDEQVRLYNKQAPDDAVESRPHFDAAQIVIAHGDLARGRIFAERAVSGWRTAFGDDSNFVLEHAPIAKNPAKHMLYGTSMKWKSAVDQVPTGLGSADFEDWLWKREKSSRPGQLVDLQNNSFFLNFTALPWDHTVDQNFFENNGKPRRHWCFLAEIVDSMMLVRLSIFVKDIDGRKLPIVFYTQGQGRELAHSLLQSGYTVAILQPKRRAFKFDDPGIRHEDPGMLKIFPISLQNLLSLSDEIQQFSTESNGLRTCHGCSKKSPSLQRCAKCSLFWYCTKDCQIAAWTEKGHQTNCKHLRDPDLRGLFALKWDEFDSRIRFPL